MTAILAAKCAGQQAVVDALLALGAKDVDPLQTHLTENFRRGELPEKLEVKDETPKTWASFEHEWGAGNEKGRRW